MTDERAPDEAPAPSAHDPDEVEPGWPWSFILLVVAGALYLVFRLVDFIISVVN